MFYLHYKRKCLVSTTFLYLFVLAAYRMGVKKEKMFRIPCRSEIIALKNACKRSSKACRKSVISLKIEVIISIQNYNTTELHQVIES